MKRFFTLVALVLSLFELSAQDVIISPLSENPELVRQFEAGTLTFPAQKSNVTLHLPFIDDFSRNHLAGNNKQYWEDNFVFVNPNYGVNPPTYGVATFDGLNFDGYPYDFDNPQAEGIADYLTSVKIDLEADEAGIPYDLADSIILSFYYQPQGLGTDPPREQDSLILEFFDPESGFWVKQWGSPGPGDEVPLSPFKAVYIPIVESKYLNSEFQFRFYNVGSLAGSKYQWHIDMVWMDKNRSSGGEVFPDVGYQFPVNNLMNKYTSIPYKHYKTTSSIHMADQVTAQLRNNNDFAINLSNVKMRNFNQGVLVNESAIPGAINFPGQTSNGYDIDIGNYVYDADIDEPFVSFKNEFVMNSGAFDMVPDNDTITFTQYFENYYAYDDGSAEAGVGLIDQGFMAVKFDALQADSIIGFKMYFNPIGQKPLYHFIMYLWEEQNSKPGSVIYINQTPLFADYIQEGHDVFSYYFFDEPVFVSGTFFAGVWQSPPPGDGVFSLKMGFDLNTDNSENTFYKVAFDWLPMPAGALMLRPVFQSEMDSIILGISSPLLPQFSIYPNPASDRVTIRNTNNDELQLQLMAIDGRLIRQERFVSDFELNVSDIPSGMYLVRVINSDGGIKVEKILVSH